MRVIMEIKHNPNAGRWPLSSELVEAELAVNTGDGKLFVKMHDGTVMHINPAGGGGGGSDPLQAAQRAFAANLLFG